MSLVSDVVVCLRSFLKNYGRIKCVSLTISCDDGNCIVAVNKQKEKNQWSIFETCFFF